MISSKLPNTRVLEYRGKVFSIGGDDKELTIPNFMKSVSDSSSLVGAPKAISLPLAQGKGMDRAVSGAIAQDLPGQATSLVNLLLLPRYLIHRSQWKLVTVLIGANNVCGDCLPDDRANTTAVVNSVREALLTLRNSAPRWKINLLGVPSVTQVYDAALPVPYCAKVFERFHFCPCIHEEKWRKGTCLYYLC
ncbi:hypothetical protein BC828DRAFT_343808 [Blastocladiella britannica]|nr:hypothetical protein BC828DRAFT_343808 [Blastocladiella britannica]